MKRVFFIETADGARRRITEADFPLTVGGSGADIVLQEALANTVVAHIALSSGHAYLQPARADTELFHNHEYISTSAWLKSGDRVQLDDRVLCWDVKGDQVFVKVRDVEEPPDLQPPPVPPPEKKEESQEELDTRVIPVVTASISPVKRRRLRFLMIGLFSVLSLIALFVLFATPIEVSVQPEPDSMSVSGFPPPVSFGSKKLVVPGSYTVKGELEGYFPLEQQFEVSSDGFQSFNFELKELPGRLQILVDPMVPVRVSVDGVEATVEAENIVLLERGPQQLTIETDRYLTEVIEL
ncbi:MAG: hypothetical protein OEU84_05230, partial [Xanthomonadales bacterium]|nr:hypothetical protein [Xanthomonadales bacterium]